MKRCLCAAITVSAVAVHAAVELPEPVVRFRMETITDGMVSDSSGNGRSLELGSSLYITNGPVAGSSALYYDGTVNAWAKFSCPALSSRTMAFWMRREPTDGPIGSDVNKFPYFLNFASTVKILTAAGTEQMRVALGTEDIGSNYPIKNAESLTATRGSWGHYVLVIEDTGKGTATSPIVNFSYWKDGELQVSKTDFKVSTSVSLEQTTILGNQRQGGNRPMFGALADFCIWDEAFTAGQVRTAYVNSRNEMAGGPELLGWWPMEEFVTNAADGYVYTPDASGMNSSGRTDDVSETNGWMKLSADTVLTNGPHGTGRAIYYTGTATTWSRVKMPTSARDTTWSMWVNQSLNSEIFRVSGQDKNFPYLMASGSNNLKFYLMSPRKNLNLQCMTLGSGTTYPAMGPATVSRETWSHLVFVDRYDASEGTLRHRPEIYLNGELSAVGEYESATDNSWLMDNGNITFGNNKHTDDGTRPFEGAVSDIRIYGGNLSADEIRRLYRSAAKADAGSDFTVSTSETTLFGDVASKSGKPYGTGGYDGEVAWSMVSAPEGGESAAFSRGSNPVTEVTLPVEGVYVFRLSVTGFDRTVSSSDVRVTRIAASENNAAPAVSVAVESPECSIAGGAVLSATASDPDSAPGTLRLSWSKVSGPGGVWFAPQCGVKTYAKFSAAGSYVLRCTADDGQAAVCGEVTVTVADTAADIASGLVRHWKCNAPALTKEEITGYESMDVDLRNGVFGPGVSGYAFKNVGYTNIFDSASTSLGETGDKNALPPNEWLTVSAWIFRDTSNENTYFCAPWFAVPFTLYLCYGRYETPKSWTQQPGFTIYQQGASGSASYMLYQLPYSLDDRWTHVCAVVNRHKTADSELWVDGVKLTSDSASLQNDKGGRIRTDSVRIGGMLKLDEINGVLSPASNTTTHVVGHRTFPGSVDEIRVYTRKLSEAEIRWLARNSDENANEAPYVGSSGAGRATRKRVADLAVEAFDDGNPGEGGISCEWEVLSGDESAVAFADRTAAKTAVTIGKSGTYLFRLKATDGERVTYGSPVRFEVVDPGTTITLR